ncbi:response regulator [Leptothermofonsia sichuanensis E412]|uniref:response regulator n=1 Tax=Leptothermofonsia sichuanensis TaxID=2917832 RepID=UPI001CA65054|nr:response regulator [Leptothermofonsia sichuanensis]QZZ20688.1 response regulator [Leptothermofonsia sichuanensis E412]
MKKILIVEDNEGIRKFISDFLRWRSFNVIEAKDGLEGWQLAIAQNPDLILSDIDMPRLSGYELLEKLQQDFNLAMIPVILMSGTVTADARNHALQLGAADFLSKPALPDTILGTLSKYLRSRNVLEIQPVPCIYEQHSVNLTEKLSR